MLSSGSGADFFEDEYRCPVYVKDVVQAIKLLMEKHFCGMRPMYLLLNIGGPDRLSRAAMAETVAQVRGYDTKLVRRVSSQTAVSPEPHIAIFILHFSMRSFFVLFCTLEKNTVCGWCFVGGGYIGEPRSGEPTRHFHGREQDCCRA